MPDGQGICFAAKLDWSHPLRTALSSWLVVSEGPYKVMLLMEQRALLIRTSLLSAAAHKFAAEYFVMHQGLQATHGADEAAASTINIWLQVQ